MEVLLLHDFGNSEVQKVYGWGDLALQNFTLDLNNPQNVRDFPTNSIFLNLMSLDIKKWNDVNDKSFLDLKKHRYDVVYCLHSSPDRNLYGLLPQLLNYRYGKIILLNENIQEISDYLRSMPFLYYNMEYLRLEELPIHFITRKDNYLSKKNTEYIVFSIPVNNIIEDKQRDVLLACHVANTTIKYPHQSIYIFPDLNPNSDAQMLDYEHVREKYKINKLHFIDIDTELPNVEKYKNFGEAVQYNNWEKLFNEGHTYDIIYSMYCPLYNSETRIWNDITTYALPRLKENGLFVIPWSFDNNNFLVNFVLNKLNLLNKKSGEFEFKLKKIPLEGLPIRFVLENQIKKGWVPKENRISEFEESKESEFEESEESEFEESEFEDMYNEISEEEKKKYDNLKEFYEFDLDEEVDNRYVKKHSEKMQTNFDEIKFTKFYSYRYIFFNVIEKVKRNQIKPIYDLSDNEELLNGDVELLNGYEPPQKRLRPDNNTPRGGKHKTKKSRKLKKYIRKSKKYIRKSKKNRK